jgi:hypothetical protein
MLKQQTVNVEGTDYLLTAYPATKGLKYQKKLAKVLLPAFAEITKNSQSEEQAISIALEKLAENLDDLDEEMLKEMVVLGATKGGMQINFDFEFSTDYAKLFNLLKELIKFNFASVFTVLGSVENL